MAKSMSNKVKKAKKRVRKRAKAVEKSVKKLKPQDASSAGKLVGVAVAGVAGVAGIAAAIQHLRKNSDRRAKLHVRAAEDHWVISLDGADDALQTFRTKEEAVEAARDAAQQAAPSKLVIHRLDGTVMKSHSYEPA